MIYTGKKWSSILGLRVQATKAALASAIVLIVIGGVGCGGGTATHLQSSSQSTPQATGAVPTAEAQPTFSVLHAFAGEDAGDGAAPRGDLVRDESGNLYGTTDLGGEGGTVRGGCGTVFKVDAAGVETVLHSFTDCVFGTGPTAPNGGLVRDATGNLYGTTRNGGICHEGTVFKLEPTGKLTVLHNFTFFDLAIPDGANPWGPLLRDASGNLYGTTLHGGIETSSKVGTVFKLDPNGKLTALHNFAPAADGTLSDGANPKSGLVRDAAGNLYGTTVSGGNIGTFADCFFFNCGTVFKLDPMGKLTILHKFSGPDGGDPEAGVILDSLGNLYGTTALGGPLGRGTVFKLDTTGELTVLHSFTGGADGANPLAGLVRDTSGNLYGTTFGGFNGAGLYGTIFKLDPTGTLSVLHTFTDGADGANPLAGLIRDPSGNFYGTTQNGGNLSCNTIITSGCGTVFKLML